METRRRTLEQRGIGPGPAGSALSEEGTTEEFQSVERYYLVCEFLKLKKHNFVISQHW